MNFGTSVKTCFSKYVTFHGRASRSEFWWWVLFTIVASMLLGSIDSILFGTVTTHEGGFEASTDRPFFSGLFQLAILLPSLAVTVRRLHDTDRTGWWVLLCLVPLIGPIVLIVWWASAGTRGPNRFGQDPLTSGGGGDYGDYIHDYPDMFSQSSIPRVPRH